MVRYNVPTTPQYAYVHLAKCTGGAWLSHVRKTGSGLGKPSDQVIL